MPEQIHGASLNVTEAGELAEMLTFCRDWLAGPDHDLLAASLRRFVGTDGYELPALQDDLARFAFLLGDDGEQLLTRRPAVTPAHPRRRARRCRRRSR